MKKVLSMVFVLALLIVTLSPAVFAATKVRIAGFGDQDMVIVEEIISKFVNPKLKSEGITVVYEPVADDYQRFITNALSAGTAADLFYMDIFWAEAVMRSGAVEPLNNYISKSKVLKTKDFIPSLLNAFTIDGKIYGIPKDFNTLALFYNKDLFDLAKAPYPDENDTWTTLEAKLKKVADLGDDIHGIALTPEYARMGALAYAAGFEPFDKKGRSNLFDPAFKSAFEWYTGLAKKKIGVMPADIGQGWGGGAFMTEKVGVALEGAWLLGAMKNQAPNLNYGATLLPKNPKTGKRGNFIYTVAWAMSKSSRDKDAAFKVLEILTSPEVQQWVLERGLAIPSRTALANNPYFKTNTRDAQANFIVFKGASDGNVKPFSFRIYGGQWMDPINQALTAVMSGQASVEAALKESQSRLDQVMNR
ncbi:MAG: ABC transporter substrate-binding protein [Syntrophothermus sp.]